MPTQGGQEPVVDDIPKEKFQKDGWFENPKEKNIPGKKPITPVN